MTAAFPAIVEALGWTLVHFTWQGAVIAGWYKLAETLVAARGPQARYVVGLGALIAMIVASGVTFATSLGGALQTPPVSVAVILAPKSFAAQALPWVDAAWLVGVAILSMRLLADLWRVQRLSRLALPAPAAVLRIFERTLARSGAARRTCLRLHAFITEPFVVGIFRSIVYLPLSAVTALAPEQLEAVLAHELEHVRRADYAWNLLQSVVETLFFYHPAVWWIGGRLRQYRELCCDDAALAACRDPLVYATALLSLAEQKRGAPSLAMAMSGPAVTGLAGSPSLLARIGRVLGETPTETRSQTRRGRRRNLAAIVALALLAAVYATTMALGGAEGSVVHKVARLTARMSAIAHVPSTPPARTYRTVIRSSAPVARPSPAALAAPVVPPAAAQGPRVVGAEVDGNQITYEVTGPPHGDLLTRLLPVPRDATDGQALRSGTVATYKIAFVAPKVIVNEAHPRGTTALDPDQNYRVVVTKVPFGTISDDSGAALMTVTAKREAPPASAPSGTGPAPLQYRCASASCRYILNNDPGAGL